MGVAPGQMEVPRHVAVAILKESIELIKRKVRRGDKLGESLRRLAAEKRGKDKWGPKGTLPPLAELLDDLSHYLDSYQESDRRELKAYEGQLKQIESPIDLSAGGIRHLPPSN